MANIEGQLQDVNAVDQDLGYRLVGDLASQPNPDRRLVDQDIYALEWALPYAGAEKPFLLEVMRLRRQMLEAELANANPFLDKMLQTQVSHQLRSRPDLQRDKIAVEQWIPALRCWLVSGYFDRSTPANIIINSLLAGDPRKKTATEALEESREEAAKIRAANEKAGDEKVIRTIEGLGGERIANFLQVEKALHTGENITVRGDDRREIESLVAKTAKAAESGDKEAQAVIERGGVADNRTCILPSTNPFRHRHRKELEGPKEA